MATEYKIDVDVSSRPKGDPVELAPFGIVENGSSFTATLSDEDADRYANNPHLKVEKAKRSKSDIEGSDA